MKLRMVAFRSIGMKLAAAMATCLVSTLFVGIFLTIELSYVAGFTKSLYKSEYQIATSIREVETHLMTVNRDLLAALVDRSDEGHARMLANAQASEASALAKLEAVAEQMPELAERAMELQDAVEAWRPLWMGVFIMAGKGGHEESSLGDYGHRGRSNVPDAWLWYFTCPLDCEWHSGS